MRKTIVAQGQRVAVIASSPTSVTYMHECGDANCAPVFIFAEKGGFLTGKRWDVKAYMKGRPKGFKSLEEAHPHAVELLLKGILAHHAIDMSQTEPGRFVAGLTETQC